jgi:membrane protease YdiL (CAAX protease family)
MRDLIGRHLLATYLLLTFTIGWAIQAALAIGGISLADPSAALWLIVLSLIPGLVAVVVARLAVPSPWQSLRPRVTRWRVPLGRYLHPMVLVATAEIAAAGLSALLGGSLSLQPLIVLVAPVVLVAAFAEETGWRGFALPRVLDRLDPVTASVMLGLAWGIWHVPAQLLDPDFDNLALAALFCGQTIGLSIVLTWAIAHGGWAVLVSAATHATWNVLGNVAPLTTLQARSLLMLAILAAAGVVIAVAGRDLGIAAGPDARREEAGG